MKKRIISDANLNGIVANSKANKVIREFIAEHPNFSADRALESEMKLRKVTLREKLFGVPAGKPRYVFAKRVSKKLTVLVDVATGKTELVASAVVDSTEAVNGKFTVNGISYNIKDTVNGQPRYTARGTVHKPRAKAHRKYELMRTEYDEAEITAHRFHR